MDPGKPHAPSYIRRLSVSSPHFNILLGLLIAGIVIIVQQCGYLEHLELQMYDLALQIQPEWNNGTQHTVVVGITENDIQALNNWPLSDKILDRLLTILLESQPRVIGVDIYRSFAVPPGHDEFQHTVLTHPNIVMVMKFGTNRADGVPGLPEMSHTDQIGFSDLLVDRDGITRRGLLFMENGGEPAVSLPLRLSLKYLEKENIFPSPDPIHPDYLRLGAATFHPLDSDEGGYLKADSRGYQFLLDFGPKLVSVPSYSIADLLARKLPSDVFRDKIVLVGVTAESVPDMFHTSYSTAGQNGSRVWGVMLQAHVTNQILRSALGRTLPRQTFSDLTEWTWTVLWSIYGGIVGALSRSSYRFTLLALSSLLLLGVTYVGMFVIGWWLPVVPSAMAFIMTAVLITTAILSQETHDRKQLMQLFSRHVSPLIAETIWRQREHFWVSGRMLPQLLTVTVLFTDLENFTPISEALDPQRVLDWTNRCLERMVEIIERHGGIVDDYFGDGVKANFGVPVPRATASQIANDARQAVECALEIQDSLRQLNQEWRLEGQPTVRMRLGLYTGAVVAGSLGARARLKYTTVGDTVNIAARLESFRKELWEEHSEERPCRILLGESTFKYLEPNGYDMRQVGDIQLKGKAQQIGVFHLIGRKAQHPK